MHTGSDGLTLIETVIAVLILFSVIAVVSEVFGTATRRVITLRETQRLVPSMQALSFCGITGDSLPGVESRVEERTLSVKLLVEGNETQTDVESEVIVPGDCQKCFPLIKRLKVTQETLKELFSRGQM